jgi:transcriptional regulator with XRE-family HTH domain
MLGSKRLSQEEVAAEAEITRDFLSALERGAHSASIDVIERLAKALGAEPPQLLDKTLPPDVPKLCAPA